MAGSKWTDQSGANPAESDADNPPMERETGITEKMLNSYGFIRCCDRQARLFFHFSQYEGLIEHLKPGDPVDFEMSFDKKSGKPIAVRVQKICSDTSINVGGGQSLVNGVVTLELTEGKGGRVAYENCGECFFFEFSRKDLIDPVHDNPRQGQPVQFVITQDAAGNLQVGEMQSVATQPQALQPVKQQQQYITTSLVYPNMMVPMMPEMISPQVIAYTPAPALQMAPIVNGVGTLAAAANGRMLHTGMNGNGKSDVELLAAHPQAQRAVYKVNLNNSIVQQTTNIQQHYSGQSTKTNTVPHQQQQLAHPAAGGSGSLNQTNGASPNNHQSPMQSKGQNNKNIKNNSLRAGDDIDQQQQDNENNTRYQGVVCTIKDTYGFVERDDVVKEIFFHCSEGYSGIALGDDVSFNITTRNNRTVAVNLERLDPGTVVFSDLDEQPRKGTVLKLYSQSEEPLNGRILCEENGEKKQYGFGDRDLAPSSWTMRSGDPVFFHVATDRRDGAQHATNITMNIGAPGAFTKETRLTGTVVTIKENYGFVLTEHDNQKYYFKLNDVLDSELRHESTVQFSLGSEHQNGSGPATTTTAGNNGSRQIAIRICKAPSPTKKKSSRKTINTMKCTHKGFISALKDHFGFIESENHQEDLFFHYTNVDGDVKDLQIGSEVEYSLVSKKDRPSAEVVRLLEKGTIPAMEPVSDEIFTGKVIRALRCHNPDQTPYCGLLEIGTGVESSTAAGESKESEEDAESSSGGDGGGSSDSQEEDQVNANAESGKEYKFSVLSLAKPGEVMQKGDLVEFQLANCKISNTIFAVNVKSVRKTAVIELMKGAVAYLNYELEGGRKLSFNTSEVTRKPTTDFAAGDLVEFDLARNGRHQKLVATNVKRIREKEASPRPAALVNRIKSMAISDEGPKVVAIRQPRGPDGTKGFAALVAATA